MSLIKYYKNIFLLAILIMTVYLGSNYVLKKNETIEFMETSYKGSSAELLLKCTKNSNELNNKVVVIEGIITSITNEGLIIDGTIFCQLAVPETAQKLKKNQSIKIKGVVIGYDDLFNELKLNRCITKE